MNAIRLLVSIPLFFITAACGNTGGGDDLDPLYGNECVSPDECDADGDPLTSQPQCFIRLSGGWCGNGGCDTSSQCPGGTRCVEHGAYSYCFVKCSSTAECNELRSEQFAAECTDEHPTTEGANEKVCVVPHLD